MFSITYPKDAAAYHFQNVKPYIEKELEKNKKKFMVKNLCVFLEEHLEEIITGKPDRLLELQEKMERFTAGFYKKEATHAALKSIFNYDTFQRRQKNGAYALTNKLGIKVCPYCNRQYVGTIYDGEKGIVRPELDHYFPQSRYPMLALSFFNLIPSCHICNSNLKGARELDIDQHYHPYVPHKDEFRFRMTLPEYGGTAVTVDYSQLDQEEQKKAENTIKFFHLDKIYEYHSEETEELYSIYRRFDNQELNKLHERFTQAGIKITKEKIVSTVYGHFCVSDPEAEPLGKLRKDLYQQIKEYYKI